jgi:hypothetical protein
MNRQVRIASMTDGTSNTLCMSEGETFAPILRDGGVPSLLGVPTPVTRTSVNAFGGSFKVDAGHVEWIDAHSIQSGFTTTFTPSTVVPFASSGKTYDVDFTSRQEGKTRTYPRIQLLPREVSIPEASTFLYWMAAFGSSRTVCLLKPGELLVHGQVVK